LKQVSARKIEQLVGVDRYELEEHGLIAVLLKITQKMKKIKRRKKPRGNREAFLEFGLPNEAKAKLGS
jgi:hypothetical protein